MRTPVDPYTCIRCGYQTQIKARIKRHFDELKKPCPGTKNIIELSNEIKESILLNRTYKIPKEEKPISIINNITTYNTLNNYINNLNDMEKLVKYIDHTNIKLEDIETTIDNKYSKEIDRLENDKYKYGFDLQQGDFVKIIDNVSKIENIEEMNILYDKDVSKIQIYSSFWESFLEEEGLKRVIELIQDYYLYVYENYLVKKIFKRDINPFQKSEYKDLLKEYFKFIGCFDVKPKAKNKTNEEILDDIKSFEYVHFSNEYEIEEYCMELFIKIKKELQKSEINNTKKRVLEVLKKNCKQNLKELNKSVLNLLNADEEFKKMIMPN